MARKTSSTLITLNLKYNSTEDSGAQALSEALRTNSTLITLNLQYNSIESDGVQALSEAPKSNQLDLSHFGPAELFDQRQRTTGTSEALKTIWTLPCYAICISESDDDVTTPAEANVLSGTDTSHGFRADEVNEAGASTRQAVHVPPPVTPISKSEAGAGIQWPVLLAASELRSPDEMDEYREQLQAKIKELIGRGMKQGTALSYAPHLVRWQSYCDESCHGDYTVEAEKIVSFLDAKLFRGKPLIIEVKDNSNILIGRTEHSRLAYPTEADAEAMLIRSRFEAGMSQENSL
ncbi:hypothetical protein BG005_002071 [Podila minutissima]|nr:hypothetical protein BG005_002071 [Podila minutissima]